LRERDGKRLRPQNTNWGSWWVWFGPIGTQSGRTDGPGPLAGKKNGINTGKKGGSTAWGPQFREEEIKPLGAWAREIRKGLKRGKKLLNPGKLFSPVCLAGRTGLVTSTRQRGETGKMIDRGELFRGLVERKRFFERKYRAFKSSEIQSVIPRVFRDGA